MKKREELQVNVAGIRRNIKNLAHNYSDAQIKVREATSNDHWGPSSTLMSEIADLTYNVVAFTEIMQMIWKRLNDHGRNWRHVYKALLLLEYLIKTGSEKVAQQCKENIYAIRTLRDFQYFEDGKDPGLNVREKAKQLVALLKDDERLRNERARAIKAKERFMQSASAFGSDTTSELELPPSPPKPAVKDSWRSCSPSTTEVAPKAELECARPQTAGEEELQLQLALAMSREEAEQEEQKRRSDDVRLQLALSQSEKEFKQNHQKPTSSHIDDLLEISSSMGFGSQPPLVDPWGMPIAATGSAFRSRDDPWRTSPVSPPPGRPVTPEIVKTSDPWAPTTGCLAQPGPSTMNSDPWGVQSSSRPNSVTPPPSIPARPTDPWTGSTANSNINDDDEFAAITKRSNGASVTPDPFDLRSLENGLSSSEEPNKADDSQSVKKTPHSFLGENSALVNLDNLITVPAVPPLPTVPQKTAAPNPFGHTSSVFNNRPAVNGTSSSVYQRDPFQPVHQQTGSILSGGNLPQPLLPQPNPFLS